MIGSNRRREWRKSWREAEKKVARANEVGRIKMKEEDDLLKNKNEAAPLDRELRGGVTPKELRARQDELFLKKIEEKVMTREELKKHVKYEEIENQIFDKLRIGLSAEISFTSIRYFVSDYGSDIDPDAMILNGEFKGKTFREKYEDDMLDAMILRMKEDLKDL